MKWLKPQGVLAVFFGSLNYLAAANILSDTNGLHYTWTLASVCRKAIGYKHIRGFIPQWKPILLFSRTPQRRISPLCIDLISEALDTSETERLARQDKRDWNHCRTRYETWQVIDRLSNPGALVVDPFVGSGTTAYVCRHLKRRFIGAEIDKGRHALATRKANEEWIF